MRRRILAAAVLAALLPAIDSHAQSAVSLLPPERAQWDVAGYAGWFGGNKSDIAPDWNDWFDAASGGVSAGYYWTPHLKIEADVFTTTAGETYSQEEIRLPGEPYPVFRSRQFRFRTTGVSAALHYQFLENAWFHPSAGAGVEAVRERVRIDTPSQFIPSRSPGPPLLVAGPTTEHDTAAGVRPFVNLGFKLYMTPRTFIRSDVRTSFSSERVESVAWRAGVGVDF
jgi:hypothetical protein